MHFKNPSTGGQCLKENIFFRKIYAIDPKFVYSLCVYPIILSSVRYVI